MPGPGALGESDSGSDPDDVTLLELQSSALLRLDNVTDISDSSDAAPAELGAPAAATVETKGGAEAAAARKLAASLVAARKRRQVRKPSVADGRAKRIRGMLTSLCTQMKFGNRDLCCRQSLRLPHCKAWRAEQARCAALVAGSRHGPIHSEGCCCVRFSGR